MQILRHASGATVMLGRFVDATDGFTQETALTIANTDIKLLKHGSTSLADKNSGGATHLSNGIYRMSLDSTDTDTLGRLNVMCQPSGARPIEREYMVISANWYDSMVGNDVFQCDVTQWLGTAAATPTVAGVPEVDVTHWLGTAAATPTVAGVPEVDITHVAGSTTNVSALATNVDTLVTRLGTPTDLGSGATVSENAEDVVTYILSTARVLAQTETGGLGLDPTIISAINSQGGTYDPDTDSLQAIRDNTGTAGAGLTEAGGTGDQFTAIPWNAAWDAEVQSEATDALVAYDPPTEAEMNARTLAAASYATSANQTTILTRIGTPIDLGSGSNLSANLSDLHGVLTVTGAKVGSIVTDAIDAAAVAASAVTKIQNGLATAASQTTILDRIGAFTGTGVNSILGFFRALMRSDATTPSDVGGTYDDATDSNEAIADQLASLPTAGPGPWGVVINVKSGGVNIQNADVTATNGSESYHDATDSSGNATFSLPTDDWDFYVYKPNYVQDDPPYEKSVTTHSLSGNNVTMTFDPPGQELTEEEPGMTATFLTAYDAVQHLRNVLGGASGDDKNDNFRQAFRFAHDEFFAEDQFKESLLQHRVQLQEPYSTGTLAFDLTGGSSERLVTLTSGTFPSWAARGTLVIGDTLYRVVSRLSNTTLQLDETFCPTDDVASGTSYTLYQDAYLLPADFSAAYQLVDKDGWMRSYVSEEEWLSLTTLNRWGSDFRWTITFDDRQPGRYALRFHGWPTQARPIDFLYKRKRKTPILDGTEDDSCVGTIAWTNGSATITGTATAFSSDMVGSVLRIGTSSQHPTHLAGRYPYKEEHVIAAVASTTSLTLKTAVGLTTASSIKYRITDPLSLDRANHVALLKGCEAQYHVLANSSDSLKRSALGAYNDALSRAKEQQSKHRDVGWSPVTGSKPLVGRPSVNVNAPS